MRRRAVLAVSAGLLVAVGAPPALAAWASSGSAPGGAGAAVLQPPASATAAPTSGSTSTSITVSWTAPSSGPAPTQYRVDRVSPAGTVCTVAATTLSCADPGRAAGTSYQYNVYALISNWKGTAVAASAATSAAADTTAPQVTADCPASGGTYSNAANQGSVTFNKVCSSSVTVSATDNVGVTSVAVKLSKGGLCWTGTDAGTAFTSAQCTAAGPTGYPSGYVALQAGAGSSWSRALSGPSLSTGSWTLNAQAKDAAGNTSSTLTFTFNIN